MLNIVCIPGMPLPFLTSVTLCHYKRERKLFFFLLALGLRIDVNNPQGPFYVGQGLFQECPSQTSSISIRIPSSSFYFLLYLSMSTKLLETHLNHTIDRGGRAVRIIRNICYSFPL